MTPTVHERNAIDCSPWRATLAERIELARAGRDIEGVHGLRVACARLEVFLRLASWRVLRSDLRWLRRAASQVRDLDVLLAGDLPLELRAPLELERDRAGSALLEVLNHERAAALLEALDCAPLASPRDAKRVLTSLGRRVAQRGRELEQSADEVENFHALRRALRRLRYAREWLGLDCAPIRELQDVLGALNDAVVERRWLETTMASHAHDEQRKQLDDRIHTHSAAALDAWRATRPRILEIPA